MSDQSKLLAELVTALELASGALAISARGGDTIAFTGPWARLGKLTVNEILDRAEAVLTKAAPEPATQHERT